jgi:hypothetical protein
MDNCPKVMSTQQANSGFGLHSFLLASTIQNLDGAPKLQSEHLQEAAQHFIIRDDGETGYGRAYAHFTVGEPKREAGVR